MAKTNYQQLRRKKEAERKNRRDAKIARRLEKDTTEPTAGGVDPTNEPAAPSAVDTLK